VGPGRCGLAAPGNLAARMAEVGRQRKARPQRPSALCGMETDGHRRVYRDSGRPDRPSFAGRCWRGTFYSFDGPRTARVNTVIGELRLPPAPLAADPARRCWFIPGGGRGRFQRDPDAILQPRPRPGQRLPRGVPVRLDRLEALSACGLAGWTYRPRRSAAPQPRIRLPPRCSGSSHQTRSPFEAGSRSFEEIPIRPTWRSGLWGSTFLERAGEVLEQLRATPSVRTRSWQGPSQETGAVAGPGGGESLPPQPGRNRWSVSVRRCAA